MWCKICGITTRDDALMAEQSGADALGFVFYAGSRRHVSIEHAAKISANLSSMKVGLFVDAEVAEINHAIEACALDLLQFQGEETPDFCAQFGVPYMKALRVGEPGQSAAKLQRRLASYASAWAVLLDAYVPGQAGGTGETFNLDLWPTVDTDTAKLILAGGLHAANVGAALAKLQLTSGGFPFGVDVSSGVEIRVDGVQVYGRKDARAVSEFLREVKNVQRK